MAYTNLFTNSLIYSATQLKATVDYEYQRVGADMQYRYKISLSVPNGYFMGDLIGVEIWLDGVKKLTGTYYDPDGTDTNGWVYDNNGTPTAWFTVANKTSGTTACRIRIYDNQGASDYSVYRPSSTTDYSLTVAPAASQPSLTDSSVPFGTAFTINSNRYDASFTHTYTYVFGGASGTIATQTADASTSWTAPNSLAAQIPTTMSGVGTITCETFSGAVSIGTKTVSFTLEIPPVAPWIPEITTAHSGFDWVNAPGIVIPSDNLSTYIIQNISTLTLTLPAGLNSIISAYGTTITSYQVRYGSKSSSEVAYTNSAVSWEAGLITQSGAQFAYYKVRDARGNWSAEISEQIMGAGGTIYPYSSPGDTGFNVTRNATVVTVADFQMNFVASSIGNQNTWTYQRQYYNGSTWVDIDLSPQDIIGTYTLGGTLSNDPIPVGGYDEGAAYSLRVVLVDKFSIVYAPDTLPTSAVPMAWAAWGIGVGKVPTGGGDYDLEVGANGIRSDGPIYVGTNLLPTLAEVFAAIYPVGSIYTSVASTSPATLFGGTWVAFGGGRVLMGIGSNGETNYATPEATGGAQTHTLTEAQTPSHDHAGTTAADGIHQHDTRGYFTVTGSSGTKTMIARNYISTDPIDTNNPIMDSPAHTHAFTTDAAGGGGSHNNMQPYIVVYMWKRTA